MNGAWATLVVAAGLFAAPPRMEPIVQVAFDVKDGRPARVLEVFDGEFLRADWIDKSNGKVDQRFWSQAEGKQFAEFLKSIDLPSRGKSAVTSDSPTGRKLLKRIEETVIQKPK